MSTNLRDALSTIRALYDVLPDLTAEQVDELVEMELKGANRRSVLMRLTSRAAQLAANLKCTEIETRIRKHKEPKNGSSTRRK